MFARVTTVAFEGIEARGVDVQVQIGPGVPAFTIVGLPDKAVAESRERVRGALNAIGLGLPPKRITVNLAPADLPKEGSHYDLPIALGLMAAVGAIARDAIEGFCDALRQPLETGETVIARANHRIAYPSRIQLIAAINPCRCGRAGEPGYVCRQGRSCAERYQARISGPLLDRIDLQIEVPAVSAADLVLPTASEGSADVRARVALARSIQSERYAKFDPVRAIRENSAASASAPTPNATERCSRRSPRRPAGLTLLRDAADALSDLDGAEQVGRKVLLVLDGIIEAALVSDLLVAMGAAVARVRLKDAERIAEGAAASGIPFTALLTDRASIAAGAARLLAQLRRGGDESDSTRAVIIVDPAERGDIPAFRAQGFNGYLVRPVRPLSLLTQLFAREPQPAQAAELRVVEGSVERAAEAESVGASILLAEDNDINALLASTVLEKSGARVVRARNGAEAVAKARNELSQGKGFDLVLMDIHMPDMDGVEAARRIRELYPEAARAGAGRPPIVALTANAFAEDRATYLAAGLDDYLAKPFEKTDLAALFARWSVEKREADQDAGLGAA